MMSNILSQFSMGFKIEKLTKIFISKSSSLVKMVILTLKCVSHVTQQGCPTHLKNKMNYEKKKKTNILNSATISEEMKQTNDRKRDQRNETKYFIKFFPVERNTL